jgi:hypothetical protein
MAVCLTYLQTSITTPITASYINLLIAGSSDQFMTVYQLPNNAQWCTGLKLSRKFMCLILVIHYLEIIHSCSMLFYYKS